MINSYKKFWSNVFNFSGKSNRPDYWWPIIINWLLAVIIIAIIQAITGHPFEDIYNFRDLYANMVSDIIAIIVWIGTLSLRIRRLHDTDRSGWWVLLNLVPVIGVIWFIILMLLPSKDSRWN
ncbi:DUF805 domain-containing protein [Companilactobacillus metriopterae]|uniref:DUF805 domain-containing protein n=1 Tax=Companilactobacillus metriopterae TaxID=1909267 RepID=UPI00100C1095|nr:DUF805 domain-containing protein [Companilactobacillus metriopterae]